MSEEITNAEFSSSLKNHSFIFETNPSVAISFSCGPDSMALVILMKNWIKKHRGLLTLIYFDHKLRKESYMESKYTMEISRRVFFMGMDPIAGRQETNTTVNTWMVSNMEGAD